MDSIIQLARFLGYRNALFIRRDLLGQTTGQRSLKKFLISTKGREAGSRVQQIIGALRAEDSELWTRFREGLRQSVARQEDKDPGDIRVYLGDFEVTKPGESILSLFANLILTGRIAFGGEFTVGVEGVVPWPAPDPDLFFTWQAEIEIVAANRSVVFSLLTRFE